MVETRMPELGALRALAIVGEEGSLSRAARRLGVSQQAVSSRMRSLELQIGATLLVRSTRGVSLTEEGTLVSGWAADLLAAADLLELGIASLRPEPARQLEVAVSLTVAEYLLPRWLLVLRTRQEAADQAPTAVGVTATNSEQVAELVRSGSVALGLVETPSLPSDLRTARIGFDELRVAVAPEHAWARRRDPLTAAELAATPLVVREQGSGTRQALERILNEALGAGAEIAPPRAELSSNAAVRAAIAAGTAPGVLSSLALADDIALGRLVAVPIAGVSLRRPLSALWRSGQLPPVGPARELVELAIAGVR